MDAAEFIESLGGTSVTARHLGIQPGAVSNAKKAGRLPSHWYFSLSRLAEQKGVEAPSELFERAA